MSDNPVFVHHVGITAPAEVLEQLVTFYDQILGLTPGYRPEFFGLGGYWLYSGDQPIVHLLEDAGRSGERSGHFDHFALRCQGINAVVAKLEQHNVEYSRIETKEVDQQQLFFTDPSGTSVELNFCGESEAA